jgi:hypothetical protein
MKDFSAEQAHGRKTSAHVSFAIQNRIVNWKGCPSSTTLPLDDPAIDIAASACESSLSVCGEHMQRGKAASANRAT